MDPIVYGETKRLQAQVAQLQADLTAVKNAPAIPTGTVQIISGKLPAGWERMAGTVPGVGSANPATKPVKAIRMPQQDLSRLLALNPDSIGILSDGRMLVPTAASKYAIFDPTTNTTTDIAACPHFGTDMISYYLFVHHFGGRYMAVLYSTWAVAIYDAVTNTWGPKLPQSISAGVNQDTIPNAFAYVGGTLFMAGYNVGVVPYDPVTKAWSSPISSPNGQPCGAIYPAGDKVLLLTGNNGQNGAFLINAATKAIESIPFDSWLHTDTYSLGMRNCRHFWSDANQKLYIHVFDGSNPASNGAFLVYTPASKRLAKVLTGSIGQPTTYQRGARFVQAGNEVYWYTKVSGDSALFAKLYLVTNGAPVEAIDFDAYLPTASLSGSYYRINVAFMPDGKVVSTWSIPDGGNVADTIAVYTPGVGTTFSRWSDFPRGVHAGALFGLPGGFCCLAGGWTTEGRTTFNQKAIIFHVSDPVNLRWDIPSIGAAGFPTDPSKWFGLDEFCRLPDGSLVMSYLSSTPPAGMPSLQIKTEDMDAMTTYYARKL